MLKITKHYLQGLTTEEQINAVANILAEGQEEVVYVIDRSDEVKNSENKFAMEVMYVLRDEFKPEDLVTLPPYKTLAVRGGNTLHVVKDERKVNQSTATSIVII